MWTCCDFCWALSPPFAESYFKAGKWSKTAEKKKKKRSQTYCHPAYIHRGLSHRPILSHSQNKSKQHCLMFSLSVVSSSSGLSDTQHFSWFHFPITCACSISVRKPRRPNYSLKGMYSTACPRKDITGLDWRADLSLMKADFRRWRQLLPVE